MQSLEKANHLKARSGRGAGRGAAAGSGAKFFDFRSDGGELGAEVFVAAVDHFRRMDRAGPLRAERRDHHRHSGADVRAGHRDRVELRLAGDHHPVRVADDRVGSHADQPVREVDPAFEHLLEEHHRAGALGGRDDRTAHHIRRILRPRAIRNLRDVTAEIALDFRLLAAGQDDPVRIKLHRDAEPLEHAAQHPVVAGRGAVHREFSVSGMSLALTLLTLLAIPTMILAAYLNGKGIAKIKLIQFGAIVDCVGFAILFFTSNGTIATASLGLIGLGFGFRSSMFFSMMPDIFDYTEWQVGRNLGGTQNAIQGFVNKVSSAAASAIVSALLVWGNYDAAKLDKAMADGISIAKEFPQTHTAINFAFGGLALVATILSIVVLIPYDLDKKYPQIRAELNQRNKENA